MRGREDPSLVDDSSTAGPAEEHSGRVPLVEGLLRHVKFRELKSRRVSIIWSTFEFL